MAVSLTVVAAGLSWWLLLPEPVQFPIVVRTIGAKTGNAQPLELGRPLPRVNCISQTVLSNCARRKGPWLSSRRRRVSTGPQPSDWYSPRGVPTPKSPKPQWGSLSKLPKPSCRTWERGLASRSALKGNHGCTCLKARCLLAQHRAGGGTPRTYRPAAYGRAKRSLSLREVQVSEGRVRGSVFLAPEEVRALDAAWRAGQRRNWQKWAGLIRRDETLVLYSSFAPQSIDRGPQVAEGGSREAAYVQGRWPGRRAVEFANSDDRIIVRFKEDITLPQATFMAWVRLDVCRDRYQTLCFAPGSLPINRTDPEFIGRFQWSLNRQSALRFAVVTGEDKPDSDSADFRRSCLLARGAPVRASRWQHLAVTYDSETRLVHFFTDGKLNNVSQPNVAPPLVIPGRLVLGNVATETTTPRDLSGRLDEFVLLSRIAHRRRNPQRPTRTAIRTGLSATPHPENEPTALGGHRKGQASLSSSPEKK